MTVFFAALVIIGGRLDGGLTASVPDKPVQGTLLCILIALVMVPAQLELSSLIEKTGAKIFRSVVIIASILLATSWYWRQFCSSEPVKFHFLYVVFVAVFSLLGLFVYQGRRFGTTSVISNCAANYFAIFYLGLLAGFVPAIRVEFGVWPVLMFVFVVKSADIGAYTIGKLFGRHKFSPKISPGKTWEGMAGAVAAAIIVAVLFATICDIMVWWLGAVFGFCFAFIGQLGDLTESMIKRDAEQKDSAGSVPGFGGILDVIDSPLVAAPFAYLFFMGIAA